MKRLVLLIVMTGFPALASAQGDEAKPADPADPAAGASPAQNPTEELFAEKCASCHSVGKGDRVGPDLKGAHERRSRDWLFSMIKSPNSLLDSDPDARALLKKFNNVRMPDLGLSATQTDELIELIGRCSVETCNLAGVFVPVTEATADDVALGRELFLGVTALKNDGPPCVSCHTARGMDSAFGGGTLSKDLTRVFARLGDEGLDAALRNPTFPLMKDIYKKHGLEKEEAFALRAFLGAANRAPAEASSPVSILLVGIVGTIACLVLLNIAWSRRLRGVRKPLTESGGTAS